MYVTILSYLIIEFVMQIVHFSNKKKVSHFFFASSCFEVKNALIFTIESGCLQRILLVCVFFIINCDNWQKTVNMFYDTSFYVYCFLIVIHKLINNGQRIFHQTFSNVFICNYIILKIYKSASTR